MTDTLHRLVADIMPRWVTSSDETGAPRLNPQRHTEAAAAAWLMRREQLQQAHQTDRLSTFRN